jgi:phosphatidylglycerol:prolipoprotein diacylglycerol transferase
MILESPLETIAIWKGGLSFHGGLFGTFLAITYASRKARVPWLSVADTMALCAPIGVCLGRIGNFMNGELWGRVTTVPWGMVFPAAGPLPRHPSQLYESFLEGFVLAVVMWWARKRVKRYGVLTSIFLVGYPVMRIICELFREPDAQLGFIFGPFTMGQLLSAAALAGGLYCLRHTLRHGSPIPEGVWEGRRRKK